MSGDKPQVINDKDTHTKVPISFAEFIKNKKWRKFHEGKFIRGIYTTYKNAKFTE